MYVRNIGKAFIRKQFGSISAVIMAFKYVVFGECGKYSNNYFQ
jgi:hypothetical protein